MKYLLLITISTLIFSCINLKTKTSNFKIKGYVQCSEYKINIPSEITFFKGDVFMKRINTNENGFYKTELKINKYDHNLKAIIKPFSQKVKKDTNYLDVSSITAVCPKIDTISLENIIFKNIHNNIYFNSCITMQQLKYNKHKGRKL